ncbi:MAG: CBS domain-containing protein [Verrucomicrobia bacterium]|nr:CBS domain-containing protein [Verrucomicrobiota bacterium]
MRTRERQGTGRKLRKQLREVMHRQVTAVGVDTPLGEAARRMRALNVTRLPVCDGPKLVGVITARDLTMRATAEGLDPQTSTVREVMTRRVLCVEEDEDLRQAVAIMQQYNLFHLPVVNRQQDLVGMVYFSDLDRRQ